MPLYMCILTCLQNVGMYYFHKIFKKNCDLFQKHIEAKWEKKQNTSISIDQAWNQLKLEG